MDTTAKYIDIAGNNNRPGFYRNISGLPQVNRSNSGGVVNSSIIPIVKRINQVIRFEVIPAGTDWQPAVVGHGLGKIYYVFTRWRIRGDTAWTMCPQPNYDSATSEIGPRFYFEKIETSSITFGYSDPNIATPLPTDIEVDIYFVDIPFNI